ncbi:hypothetical protein XalbCFBP2523_14060 [Xanthomonas albilineans]|nr:hypothetical protein XalbCFBP2523_14060 [Xanthomonas albilineans]
MVAALASVPAGWAQQGGGVPSAASTPASAAPGMASTPPRMVLEGGGVLRLEASGQTLVLTAADTPHPLRTWSLLEPRQGASLTRLADGRVLLWGGAGKDGALRKTGVLIDPQQDGWTPTALDGVQPRAGHSATLLSDGRLLVAGGKGAPDHAQLWDPRTQQVTEIAMPARVGHSATLQADGKVRLSGGTDGRGQPASQDLVFDPATGTFASAGPVGAAFGTSLAVAAAAPKDQDAQVDPATRIALRFTRPVRGSEVNGSTVALMGPAGPVEARVTTAEGGRLVRARTTPMRAGGRPVPNRRSRR